MKIHESDPKNGNGKKIRQIYVTLLSLDTCWIHVGYMLDTCWIHFGFYVVSVTAEMQVLNVPTYTTDFNDLDSDQHFIRNWNGSQAGFKRRPRMRAFNSGASSSSLSLSFRPCTLSLGARSSFI